MQITSNVYTVIDAACMHLYSVTRDWYICTLYSYTQVFLT